MEVITVRKSQKLWKVIKEIANGEELPMIFIDNTLIEKNKLIQERKEINYSYVFEEEGYKIIVDAGDNANGKWYLLWYVIKPKEQNIYSFPSAYFLECLYRKVNYKQIYIRRWGSKTKIGEE